MKAKKTVILKEPPGTVRMKKGGKVVLDIKPLKKEKKGPTTTFTPAKEPGAYVLTLEAVIQKMEYLDMDELSEYFSGGNVRLVSANPVSEDYAKACVILRNRADEDYEDD